MFFSNLVPPKARDAYNKDAWSGILSGVMMGLAFPFFVVVARKQLGASDLQVAFLTMAPVMGNLFTLFWAQMMEGRRKMPFAYASWVLGRILLILLLFAVNAPVFVVMVTLFWLITSIANPAYSDMVREIYPDGDRARIMGYVRACMWFVSIIVTLIAGRMMDHGISYRVLFPIAGVFGIVSAWVFARIPTSDAHGDIDVSLVQFAKGCWEILRDDKGFRWFCIGIFIYGFANFMATPIYALYEIDVLHAGEARQSIYYVAVSVAMMVSCYVWGSHVDRKRPEKMVAIQELVWALIPISYLFVSKWWMLLPTKIVWGALSAGVDLAYINGVFYFAPPKRMMQYQAVFAVLMGIRGFLGPLLGGVLLQYRILPMRPILAMSAVMIFASVVVQLTGARKYGPLPDAGG